MSTDHDIADTAGDVDDGVGEDLGQDDEHDAADTHPAAAATDVTDVTGVCDDETQTGDPTQDYDAEMCALADVSSRPPVWRRRWGRLSTPALTLLVGLIMTVALAGLTGWLAYRAHHLQLQVQQRDEFVAVARQGAINLTTIDWEHADADVQRILDTASGTFFDDFSKRSQPFIDVVRKTKSKSQGTVTTAGLESATDSSAQVLVAVAVKTTNAGTPDANQRAWRMRIFVQKAGNDVKVDNVEFVP